MHIFTAIGNKLGIRDERTHSRLWPGFSGYASWPLECWGSPSKRGRSPFKIPDPQLDPQLDPDPDPSLPGSPSPYTPKNRGRAGHPPKGTGRPSPSGIKIVFGGVRHAPEKNKNLKCVRLAPTLRQSCGKKIAYGAR